MVTNAVEPTSAMNTIYKYKLKQQELQYVEMPLGAEILSAQSLGVHVWVWALVNADEKQKERRWVAVYKTGEPIQVKTDELKFIDTCQFEEGALVLHVFEFVESK
jgi:hypothetical protein